ncbi:MAG: TRAP transporter substrate-binding protein [Planctomycetes bacterium]|nr:TRAP transporter substrate-binding protein [Planctomycetota bacterium]
MRKCLILIILALMCLSCDDKSSKKVIVLKLGHGLDNKHPVHKAMERMAELVDEKSGGTLRVEIFPSEQLGNEKECIEALQLGYLAMTKTSSGVMEAFVPMIKVFGLPYLFRDSEHFWKVCLGDIGKELLDAGSKTKGLKGLCYYDSGARSFYSKDHPINTPADLQKDGKKLKVRVMNSPMAISMVTTMGASPTPIAWGELYTSLDAGVVDAAENNPPSFQLSGHYEICKFYTLDEHVRLPDMLIISTRVWEKLSKEHQVILKEAVDESVIVQRKLWEEAEAHALDVVQKAGVTVVRPDKAPFQEAVKPIWDKYKGTELGKLAEEIIKEGK